MHQANAPSTVASPFDFPCSHRKRTSRRSRSVSSRCASQIYRDDPSRVATTTPRCSRRQVRRGVVFAHLPSSSSSSSRRGFFSSTLFIYCASRRRRRLRPFFCALFFLTTPTRRRRWKKKKKSTCPNSPSLLFFFFFFLWNFSLVLKLHIEERESKKKGKKKSIIRGETRRRDAQKKKESSAQPGARTQDLSLTIPECFWCLLIILGERSDQLVK